MKTISRLELLQGHNEPQQELRMLRAGPITAALDGVDLRCLRLGEVELVGAFVSRSSRRAGPGDTRALTCPWPRRSGARAAAVFWGAAPIGAASDAQSVSR